MQCSEGASWAPLQLLSQLRQILAMALIMILNVEILEMPLSLLNPRCRWSVPGEGRGLRQAQGMLQKIWKAANIMEVIFKLSGNTEAGDWSYKRHWLLT